MIFIQTIFIYEYQETIINREALAIFSTPRHSFSLFEFCDSSEVSLSVNIHLGNIPHTYILATNVHQQLSKNS